MLHTIFIRLMVILGGFITYWLEMWNFGENGISLWLFMDGFLLIPALLGLFFIKNFGRLFYLLFLGRIVFALLYNWFTAASPFRWEWLDLGELLSSFVSSGGIIIILFGIYLYIPAVNKLFKKRDLDVFAKLSK